MGGLLPLGSRGDWLLGCAPVLGPAAMLTLLRWQQAPAGSAWPGLKLLSRLRPTLWVQAVGIPVMVGYGLTETSPVLSVRRHNSNVRGSIGPAFPDTGA